MKQATHAAEFELPKPILPQWIMDGSGTETRGSNDPETAGFASGSALALLHVALNDPNINVPTELLRNRLALRAAADCLKLEGRGQTEADIRDAYLLAAPGDDGFIHRGPAGDMLAFWKKGMTISLRSAGWKDRVIDLLPEIMREDAAAQIISLGEATGKGPVITATAALMNILERHPREEGAALFITDILLAKGLSWAKPVPLMAQHLKRPAVRDLLIDGDRQAFRIACHLALAKAGQDAVRLAHDLARRAGRLRAVEPKLRTKGSQDAVRLFLSEDAVLPSSMLSPTIRGSSTAMTPRSARRFCDRLIELGVVRELTGRSSFRLYGVA